MANSGMITGPAAYDILGNLKMLLYHLTEVTIHLPRGLQMSLLDENITVTDQDMMIGTPRHAQAQIAVAALHLDVLTRALAEAGQRAGDAQEALNAQGFEPRKKVANTRPAHVPLGEPQR